MSNMTEVTIKSSEVEIITPSAEWNENSCEITSVSRGQFSGPALRRHCSMPSTAVQTASSGDAADVGLGLPSAASTQEPVMTDSLQPANDSG